MAELAPYHGEKGVQSRLANVWSSWSGWFSFLDWTQRCGNDQLMVKAAYGKLWKLLYPDLRHTYFPAAPLRDMTKVWPEEPPMEELHAMQHVVRTGWARQLAQDDVGSWVRVEEHVVVPVHRLPLVSSHWRTLSWQLLVDMPLFVGTSFATKESLQPIKLLHGCIRPVYTRDRRLESALAVYTVKGRRFLVVIRSYEVALDPTAVVFTFEHNKVFTESCWHCVRLCHRGRRTGCQTAVAESWHTILVRYWDPRQRLSSGAFVNRMVLLLSGYSGTDADEFVVKHVVSMLKGCSTLAHAERTFALNASQPDREIAHPKLIWQLQNTMVRNAALLHDCNAQSRL